MNSLSILSGLDPATIRRDPCPYIVKKEACSYRLYQQLCEEFPDYQDVLLTREWQGRSPGPFRYHAARFFTEGHLSPRWRMFIDHHCSSAFLSDVLDFWKNDLQQYYPHVLQRPRDMGIRGLSAKSLNCEWQFSWSHFPGRAYTLAAPHLDNQHTILFLLWYFRLPGDTADGGDLVLYRPQGQPQFTAPRWATGPLEEVARVPYRANTLVMVLNTPTAIHAVTERQPSEYPRRLVNFNLEGSQKLFAIPGVPA